MIEGSMEDWERDAFESSVLALADKTVPIITRAKFEDMVIDFETFSECDLKECGATVYAQHASTEILCMSYRNKSMPKALVWVPGRSPFPQLVLDHIIAGNFIEAHNAGFERAIWKYVLMPWKNLPDPKQDIPWPKRWKDTMAKCAMLALPQKLEEVGEVLNLPIQKDKRGKVLLQKLTRLQKPTKKNPETRNRDPLLLEELYVYCGTDTDAEWSLKDMIGDLPDPEYKIWVLDQKINDRGVCVDTDAVHACIKVVELVEVALTKELREITGGMVTEGSKLPAMKEWFATQGCAVGDLTADTVKRALDRRDLKPVVRRVFQIRQTLSKASAKKLIKFLSCCAADGRLHGLLQYHGAGTGRWAGRLVQPQNFPRGDDTILSLFAVIFGEADEQGMNGLITSIQTRNPEYLDILYGDAMNAIASALRGMIVAGPGNKFYVADFAAIEARVTAWLYGEEWKLQAFESVDRGEGYKGSDDIYCAAAAMIFGRPIKKKADKPERQVGKMCELAFGYQGGVGAWRNFDTRQPGDKGYVEDETVDSYKVAWREAHPNIQSGWYGIEETAINAVRFEGPFSYAYVTYEKVVNKAGTWLTCTLPNGRKLWYYNPKVESYIDRWGREKFELTYEGKDNKHGGMWSRVKTYGGMLTENVVQAISRDLMVEAMIRVEQAGYPIVLTVHDEIICETKNSFGSSEEFDRLMCIVPPWAEGCPITASGWTGIRYHKE